MIAYTDGACRGGNPGQTSCAFVVYSSTGDIVIQGKRYLGPIPRSNNYAEYQAMLDLLRWAEQTQTKNLLIFCDSKLVVEQVLGNWKVHQLDLLPYQLEAHALFVRGGHALSHIRGHAGIAGNEYVDKLCNEVLNEELQRA